MSGARRVARPRALLSATALVAAACVDLHVAIPGATVSVRMTPDTIILRVGDSARVKAAALDGSGSFLSQKVPAWSAESPGIASVNDTGLVHAVSPGSGMIVATVEGVQGKTLALVTGAPDTAGVQAGNNQSAAVNTMVTVAPSVRVTDAFGNPVPLAAVTFAVAGGGGFVSPNGPVLTGLNGVASATSWTLGPSAGANTLTATLADTGVTGNPVAFTATGTHGPPDATQSSILASPTTIAPSNGVSFANITVTVRDSAGSTITGATVVLAATGSGNIVAQPVDTTDAQGRVTGALSSSVTGTKTVSATVNGTVLITQTASVLVSANAPAGLGVAAQPAGAVSNTDFLAQPVVQIQDAFGNLVPTASGPVTVSLVVGNGTLVSSGGTFTVNAVNGVATFSGLRIRGTRTTGDTLGTGPHVLQFSTPGFPAVRSDTFQVGVSFGYNITDIWSRNGCSSGCHSFGTYAQDTASTSLSCAGRKRIVPNDTTNSFIYEKIKGVPSCGGQMPASPFTALSPAQVRLVRDWILQGGKNN